eukprot:6179791-Pleurochrysis_carterae.AAC.3
MVRSKLPQLFKASESHLARGRGGGRRTHAHGHASGDEDGIGRELLNDYATHAGMGCTSTRCNDTSSVGVLLQPALLARAR